MSRGASSKPEILHLQISDSSVAKLSRKYFAIDQWTVPASILSGTLFRSINKAVRVWGMGFTPKVIWSIVKRRGVQYRSRGSCAP